MSAIHNHIYKHIIKKRKNYLMDNSGKLIMRMCDFKLMLGYHNVPSYIQPKVIQEMEEMGLIKVRDKKNIILLKKNEDDSGWF